MIIIGIKKIPNLIKIAYVLNAILILTDIVMFITNLVLLVIRENRLIYNGHLTSIFFSLLLFCLQLRLDYFMIEIKAILQWGYRITLNTDL